MDSTDNTFTIVYVSKDRRITMHLIDTQDLDENQSHSVVDNEQSILYNASTSDDAS